MTDQARIRRPGSRGASLLLEVVFGLGIFTACLLMIFGIFPNSQRAATQAKNVSIATNLAREFLDRERALPYGDVVTLPTEFVPVSTTVNGVTATTVFEVTVTVDEPEVAKRKVITVEVAWTEGPLRRTFVLESFKVDYPVLVGS